MEQIKIIFADLDLTLLHSDGTLSDYTVSVLNQCRKKGILIGFCTSRGITRVEEYAQKIHPEIKICNAGATIYFNDKLIHSQGFSVKETQALLSQTYKVLGSNAEITVDTADDFFWNKKEDKSTRYGNEAKYNDLKNFPYPAIKFCAALTDEKKAKEIASAVDGCCYVAFSDIPWYKFSPASSTKENGIKFISEYLNIPLAQMISFGDDFTDMGMLKTTGKGIAMENAIAQVKQIATEITLSCDNDGVAYYIEKNIL